MVDARFAAMLLVSPLSLEDVGRASSAGLDAEAG